jgi:hypothetical protein
VRRAGRWSAWSRRPVVAFSEYVDMWSLLRFR